MALGTLDSPVAKIATNPLAPSETTASVSGNTLGYGSYSGCDIKVIVHMPARSDAEANLLQEIAEYERLRDREIADFNKAYPVGPPPITGDLANVTYQDRLNYITDSYAIQINKRQESLAKLNFSETKVLGEIQTLSYSIFREKSPVRTLGSVYPRSYVRGPRCIPAGEKVFIKDKGIVNIEEVRKDDFVQSSGVSFNRVVNTFEQGIKECYSLCLENGYSLKASYDHPVSTSSGWVHMKDLKIGDKVHVCGNTPSHDEEYKISDQLLKLIGYLIGDGTTRTYNYNGKKTTRIGLSIADNEMDTIGKDSEECLVKLGIEFLDSRRSEDKCITRVINVCETGKGATDWRLREYNQLHNALLVYNQYDRYSFEKQIPQEFLSGLSTRQIVLFLRHLFATDGGYSISKDKKYIEFKYGSTSELLIDQLRLLLSKLGLNVIKARENKVGKQGGRPDIVSRHDFFTLVISDSLELLRFIKRIGIFGKDERIQPYIGLLMSRIKYHFFDIDPRTFWGKVKETIAKQNLSRSFLGKKFNIYNYKEKITPKKALSVASCLNDESFHSYVESLCSSLVEKKYDLLERKVISISNIGNLPVYDLEVEDRHCFACNGIIVHNTIGGSMVFTIFNQHVLYELLDISIKSYNTGARDFDRFQYTTNLSDQLPPLDMTLLFANEYGAISYMGLYGVEFVQEGGTFSIEDIFSESVVQYVARDLDPLRPVLVANRGSQGIADGFQLASNLSKEKDVATRRNNFI
jgi:intein/homing endonuclease